MKPKGNNSAWLPTLVSTLIVVSSAGAWFDPPNDSSKFGGGQSESSVADETRPEVAPPETRLVGEEAKRPSSDSARRSQGRRAAIPATESRPNDEPALISGRTVVVPTVEIQQRVPPEIRPGKPIPVEITVSNIGTVAVEKALVTKTLESNVQFVAGTPTPNETDSTLIWSLGRLEPGQRKVLQLTLQLAPSATSEAVLHPAEVSFTTAVASVSKIHAAKLVVDLDGPRDAIVGVPVRFSICVTNSGTAAATNVVVHDHLPEGLIHPYGAHLESEVGQLAPGQKRTLDLTVTPTQPGSIVNVVRVTADGAEPVQQQMTLTSEKIQMSLQANGPKSRHLNRPLTYQFTATNRGAADANEVQFQATLPTGLTFAKAGDNGQHDSALQTVTWSVGQVKAGESKTVSLTAIASTVGEHACRISLRSAGGVKEEAECLTTVRGVPTLRMEVVDLSDPIEVGGTTTYEIRIANQGMMPASNVVISADLPQELELRDAQGPSPHKIDGAVLSFAPMETLAANTQVVFRVTMVGKKTGESRFRVRMSTDDSSRPVTEEEGTTVIGDDE